MLYNIIRTIVKIIVVIIFRVNIKGKHNIPLNSACILCFNHTSYWDPPVVGVFIPGKPAFMAKDTLFKVPVLGSALKILNAFPVKRGVGDLGAIKMSLKILADGNILAMYPEGSRSKGNKSIRPKPGIAYIATKAEVPVVPVGISGKYRPFSKVYINIGKPIILKDYYKQKLNSQQLQSISDNIMQEIHQLVVK